MSRFYRKLKKIRKIIRTDRNSNSYCCWNYSWNLPNNSRNFMQFGKLLRTICICFQFSCIFLLISSVSTSALDIKTWLTSLCDLTPASPQPSLRLALNYPTNLHSPTYPIPPHIKSRADAATAIKIIESILFVASFGWNFKLLEIFTWNFNFSIAIQPNINNWRNLSSLPSSAISIASVNICTDTTRSRHYFPIIRRCLCAWISTH